MGAYSLVIAEQEQSGGLFPILLPHPHGIFF